MPTKVLAGQTIVLTGTKKTQSIMDAIESHGGRAAVFPLITTRQFHSSQDEINKQQLHHYDWLIFTSQNAVDYFIKKIGSMRVEAKIASVGEKTTKALADVGLSVAFSPTIYSADYFVREFPTIVSGQPKCLFIRGDQAKSTIKEGLPFCVDEWTVYETIANITQIPALIDCVQHENVTVIFASPSAVQVFHEHVAPLIGWQQIRVAAIGHITAKALQDLQVEVAIQPAVYTMEAVLQAIILSEGQR